MPAGKRRRRGRPPRRRESPSASLETLPLPEIATADGSPDAAVAALEQSVTQPDDQSASTRPDDLGNVENVETARLEGRARDAADVPAKSDEREKPDKAPRAKAPKPIALEAKELRGLQVSELRALLVTERRRNRELADRLEKESPIAHAALDKDLQEGLAETATILSEGVAFLTNEPEAKLPPATAERLGRVWAPIVTKYAAEHAEYVPIANAVIATVAAVMDRAAAVKEARELRAELAAERQANAALRDGNDLKAVA